MTSDEGAANNKSKSTLPFEHNADESKMKEVEPKPLSNDIESDVSSCDEDIEEKLVSEASDGIGDNFYSINNSNLSKPLKTVNRKLEKTPLPDISENNADPVSKSLRPIRQSKTSDTSCKLNVNNDMDCSEHANVETHSTFATLKADLPGRVSFSKNDVYEIDYSDCENDTDTSRSLEPGEVYRKKNVRFEDEFFQVASIGASPANESDRIISSSKSNSSNSSDEEGTIEVNCDETEKINYFCNLKCNDSKCSHETASYVPSQPSTIISRTKNNAATTVTIDCSDNRIDDSDKIIEGFKREMDSIDRRHKLEMKDENDIMHSSSEPRNEIDSKEQTDSVYWNSSDTTNAVTSKQSACFSNASDDSPTRESISTVINNYKKAKNDISSAQLKASATPPVKQRATSASKKIPAFLSNGNGRKIKSAQTGPSYKSDSSSNLTKARSISCLQNSANDSTKLNEFHIDKVESWMSTHNEDTFSDTAPSTSRKNKFKGNTLNLEYKKAWRETPTSNKTDDEGNFSLDDQLDTHSVEDSSFGEIELVLKKMEGRRMKISFGEYIFSIRIRPK